MTKDCPQCSSEVPEFVRRCKSCFYDFSESEKSPSILPVAIGAGLLILSLIGFLSARHLVDSHVVNQYVFDEETRSLIVGTNTKDGLTAKRISFDDISQIEHVIGGEEATYEIVALLQNGERLTVRQSRDSLALRAETIARNIKIPFTTTNNTRIGRD